MLNFVNGAIKKTHLFAILALTSKRVEGIIVSNIIKNEGCQMMNFVKKNKYVLVAAADFARRQLLVAINIIKHAGFYCCC